MASVAPTRRGSRFHWAAARVVLVVDADIGGRVAEFSRGGRNVLFGAEAGENWGSTFWTSPQSDWGWPPPSEIDRQPYTVSASVERVSLTSEPCPDLGVSVRKDFSMTTDGVVTIEYSIANESDRVCIVAPWEVTRVPKRGTSFFRRAGPIGSSPQFPAPPHEESDGIVWLRHEGNEAGDRKLNANGPCRWLAHAADGLLFVKTFEGAGANTAAPDEAAIEIFVSGGAPYVELEEQGSYEAIEPGRSRTWRVQWRLVDGSSIADTDRTELSTKVRAWLPRDFG